MSQSVKRKVFTQAIGTYGPGMVPYGIKAAEVPLFTDGSLAVMSLNGYDRTVAHRSI